jgi:hypothetical protein
MSTIIQTLFEYKTLDSDPSGTPASGYVWHYALSDGFYQKDETGLVTKLGNVSGGSTQFITVEVDLGSVKRSGHFNITSSGLTVGKQVMIYQATSPYTGKGTMNDESEMDSIIVNGVVTSSTNIKCFWNSNTFVKGNFKFNYLINT